MREKNPPIETESVYRKRLRELERLMKDDPLPDSPKGERLKFLAEILQEYERKIYPFDPPSLRSKAEFEAELALGRVGALPGYDPIEEDTAHGVLKEMAALYMRAHAAGRQEILDRWPSDDEIDKFRWHNLAKIVADKDGKALPSWTAACAWIKSRLVGEK